MEIFNKILNNIKEFMRKKSWELFMCVSKLILIIYTKPITNYLKPELLKLE